MTHARRACVTDGQFNREVPGFDLQQFGFGFEPKRCRPYDEPIMYGFAIGVGSNFRMMAFVDPGIVSVGEPIQLNAEITEFGLPTVGCVVTVEARAPDGTRRSFVMRDDGTHGDGSADDGNYGHRFIETYIEGTYEFTFRASGQSRDGESVDREAVRAKYVQGRVPLVPPHGGDTRNDECCIRLSRWLWIAVLLLLLILIVMLLIWRS